MKKQLLLRFVLLLITFTSCSDTTRFEVPKELGTEQNEQLQKMLLQVENGEVELITIQELKDNFFKSRRATKITQKYLVKGYVTSSDESGNFYKAFYMQDHFKNPTSGLKVSVNKSNSYTQFNVGREVYVYLENLYVGESDRAGDNEVTIGGFVKQEDTRLDPISENQLQKHVLRSTTTEQLIPLEIALTDIKDTHVGLFVKIQEVQFAKNELGNRYFDPKRDYDTERTIQFCNSLRYNELKLETSEFANFAKAKLPEGNGSISAIVIKDYARELRLAINSLEDVAMNDTRCSLTIDDLAEFTVKDLRSLFTDNEIIIEQDAKIKVVITSDVSKGNIDAENAFAQDTSAGIALHFDTPHDLKLGDEIEIAVKGLILTQNNGLLQLNLTKEAVFSHVEGTIHTPKTITIEEALGGTFESSLVKIEGVQFKDITKTYSGTNIFTSDCINELPIFISDEASFSSKKVNTKKGDIIGILTNNNGVHIHVRDKNDIQFTEEYGCGPTAAQQKSLSEIRALYTGNEITIRENSKIKVVVTSDVSNGNIDPKNAFAQDASAGIALHFDAPHNLKLGDEIEVYLKDVVLAETNGLLALTLSKENILNKTVGTVPNPVIVTIEEALSGTFESTLVKIEGVQLKDITKKYSGTNIFTSNCVNKLIAHVSDNASFSSEQVSDQKGYVIGVLTNANGVQIHLRNSYDINFDKTHTCITPKDEEEDNNDKDDNETVTGKFNFEDITTISTSYDTTETLTAPDGTLLSFIARTNLGKYAIDNQGLMLKDEEHIKISFPNGVKQLKFKYRGAFTNASDRIVIVYEGDENSTNELVSKTFAFDTNVETLTIELNKTEAYTITIKGGTSKQIVIDDIEWTN